MVDDEQLVRDTTSRMLARAGFKVLVAKNGREGVEVFRKHAYEVDGVLLDLTMPEMDGYQAYDELCRIRNDVRVILVSGHSEQEFERRFASRGVAWFLQKPFPLESLMRALSLALPR